MMNCLPLLLSAAMMAGAPSSAPKQEPSPRLVTTLSGSMTVVKGVLKTDVNPGPTAQTISLLVGTATVTVPSVIVPGTSGQISSAGTPFVILKSGSAPFASNFTTLSVTVDTTRSYSPSTSRRSVAMTNTGVLASSVGFPNDGTGTGAVEFLYPACSSGGFSFVNGLQVTLGAFPASYSIAWPTPALSPTAAIAFRTDELPPYYFAFSAKGAKSNIFAGGIGTNRTLNVVSSIDVAGTVFQGAQLSIACNYTYGF